MNKRGYAGLPLLLSIITLLFLIGMVVFLFTLMGGQVSDSLPQPSPIVNDTTFQEAHDSIFNPTEGDLDINYVNVNYTKPAGAIEGAWFLVTNEPLGVMPYNLRREQNITFSSACWNADPTQVRLRYSWWVNTGYSGAENGLFECWNGTGWGVETSWVTAGVNTGACSQTTDGFSPDRYLQTSDSDYTANTGVTTIRRAGEPATGKWFSFGISGCGNATTESKFGIVEQSVYWVTQSGGVGGSPAIPVIDDTKDSIAGVTTWFAIIIVIGAMVVLIGLVVLIINAIKQTRLVSA